MRAWLLASKDLRVTLVSPMTYVLLAFFSLICAYFFFNLLASFTVQLEQFYSMPARGVSEQPHLNGWVVEPYFRSVSVLMIFVTPLALMRLSQIDGQNGLRDFSRTLPVSNLDFVFGRTIALCAYHLVLLCVSLSFPVALSFFGNPEVLPILSGFVGLTLCVLAFCSLGLSISFLIDSPLATGAITFVLLLALYTIDFPAESLDGTWATVLRFISPMGRLEPPLSGVLELGGLMYFLSLFIFGIFLSQIFLSQRRSQL